MGVWLPPHRYVSLLCVRRRSHTFWLRADAILCCLNHYLSTHLAAEEAAADTRPPHQNTIHTCGEDLDFWCRFGCWCLHTKWNETMRRSRGKKSARAATAAARLYWINFQVLFPLGRLIIAGVNGMCYEQHGTAVGHLATQRTAEMSSTHTTYCRRCRWVFGVCAVVHARPPYLPFINEIYKFHFNRKNIISSRARRYAYLYGTWLLHSRCWSRISAIRSHFSISIIRLIVIVDVVTCVYGQVTHSSLGRIFIFP